VSEKQRGEGKPKSCADLGLPIAMKLRIGFSLKVPNY